MALQRADATAAQITPDHVSFENSSAVISSAQKLILPVPDFGADGEPLVYPASDPRHGQPITDWQGNPIGDRGIVFFNEKDNAWQAAPGDGTAVVIINEVSAEQARRLFTKIHEYQPDPNHLSLDELKAVLEFARTQMGLRDMYNSDRAFIASKMSPVTQELIGHQDGRPIECFGLMKRDDRDICQAVLIPGRFTFEGPAATAQVFDDGGVIVKQGNSCRGVQPDVFERTYRHRDGRRIRLDSAAEGIVTLSLPE